MSSPADPALATPAEANPNRKAHTHFEAFGIRLPLPRWAIICVGIIAILGSGASVVLKFLPQSPIAVVAGNPSTQPTPTSSSAPQSNLAVNKVSEADMIQYREAFKHRDHTPRIDKLVLQSPDLGSINVKFFVSDGCVQITRTSPGSPDGISIYVPESSIKDLAPGKIHEARALLPHEKAIDANSLQAKMVLASFAPARVEETVEATGCVNPHPGEFRWWNGETRGCWLQVWRAWPDGCQHYQWFNTCNGFWDSEPNGAPRVYWTTCNH